MALKGLDILHCPVCGGTNVQIMAWINANTNEYVSDVNTPLKEKTLGVMIVRNIRVW